MAQKTSLYEDYHQLESDQVRNKNLEKSLDSIQTKLQSLQKEAQQALQPQDMNLNDYYLLTKNEKNLSPIESQVHTYITTASNNQNNQAQKGRVIEYGDSRPGPKMGNPMTNIKNMPQDAFKKSSNGFGGGLARPSSRQTASFRNKNSGAEDIKNKLKKIFQFYTTFGDRCNTSNLKSNKFHKMMIDANIRDHHLTQKQLDLLFVAENKHKPNMEFETFLQLLVKIAEQRYENSASSKEALQRFIKEHMLPLYNNIYNHTDVGVEDTGFKEPIKENVLLVLKTVHVLLLKIYTTYFPWEIRTCQEPNIVKQRNELALFTFLKEFDVCPSIMTKSTTYMIWTEVMETPLSKLSRNPRIENMVPFLDKDIGLSFTFSRFCTLLVRIASIAYEEHLRTMGRSFSQAEKLAMLFERMDLSFGMNMFEKKTSITHNSKTSLLIPKEILEKASREWSNTSRTEPNEDLYGDRGFGKQNLAIAATVQDSKSYRNMLGSGKKLSRSGSAYLEGTGKLDINYLSPEVASSLERYNESLMRIFQYYCSYGEPMNTTKLKSIKFMRLLKESGLIATKSQADPHSKILDHQKPQNEGGFNKLTQTEADIIFVSLTGTRQKDLHEKDLNYDPNIRSPYLGNINHLSKVNNIQSAPIGKMGYEAFLKALEMVAHKTLPDYEVAEAVVYVLERHILELDIQITEMQTEQRYMGGGSLKLLVELLQDPEMVSFLSLVHKSMITYYSFYADSRGLLNFEKFVQFCKHFGIFPDILPKSRIKSFFQTLAAIHSQSEGGDKQIQSGTLGSELKGTLSQSRIMHEKKLGELPEEEVIDQHLFIEGLALCAFDINYSDPQPTNIEKICYFLERLNQSEGSIIVQKSMGLTRSPSGASWDILYHIKQKYPDMFGNKLNEVPQTTNFEDLLSSTTWDVKEGDE